MWQGIRGYNLAMQNLVEHAFLDQVLVSPKTIEKSSVCNIALMQNFALMQAECAKNPTVAHRLRSRASWQDKQKST